MEQIDDIRQNRMKERSESFNRSEANVISPKSIYNKPENKHAREEYRKADKADRDAHADYLFKKEYDKGDK